MTALGDNELSGRGGQLMRTARRDIDSFNAVCGLPVSAIAGRCARIAQSMATQARTC
jgi:hypothetical protein